jgi:hypothetical protein
MEDRAAMLAKQRIRVFLSWALLSASLLGLGAVACDEESLLDADPIVDVTGADDLGPDDAFGDVLESPLEIQETLAELPPAELIEEIENEIADETEVTPPPSWREVEIAELRAPERELVTVTFDRFVSAEAVLSPEAYQLGSENGPLAIKALDYDEDAWLLTLSTEPQALGLTITLSIDTGEEGRVLQASTLAAERARFWVSDMLDEGNIQKQITALRLAVGENSVVYVEEGETLAGTSAPGTGPEEIALEFDAYIYPILSALLIEPSDVDGNGRIVILGLDGGDAFGGYVNPVNQYPDDDIFANYGMHSNEMEIVHLNTRIDPWSIPGTTAHEFQHLLYHARHGLDGDYWEYHDEGLAECAVHAVYGYNERAVDYYQWDPYGILAGGLSLVNWGYGQYENYVQAYLFWVYVAAQMTGDEQGFRTIFDLESGNPSIVSGMLQDELGTSLPIMHMLAMATTWVQAASGPYSFKGMLPQQGGTAPTVQAGTSSVDLEPFSGVFFRLNQDEVETPAPGTIGDDILYLGLNGAGQVDLDAPYDVSGGVLLTYNRDFDYSQWTTQPSGPGLSPMARPLAWSAPQRAQWTEAGLERFPRWMNPPPVMPDQERPWRRWREARKARKISAQHSAQ